MRFRDLALLAGGVGAGMYVYGAVVEANRLVLERHTLPLKGWPEALKGYRIAVVSDLHLLSPSSIARGRRAIRMALEAKPDMVVLPGDLVQHWTPEISGILADVLAPLKEMEGNAIAIPGNHDGRNQPVEWMAPVLESVGVKLLINEQWRHEGVTWVGIDSAAAERARIEIAMAEAPPPPAIVLWHEPDVVSLVPSGCVLQISGHSHGGQFRLPGGITPVYSDLGRKYPRGFYPNTRTPIYVSRGVGTTLLPTRFLCPPEVSLLILEPG